MSGLFGSATLDVIIGLFFVYFLLSVLVSNINERVSGLLKLRAQYLFWGLANLLQDSDTFTALIESPLIKALSTGAADEKLKELFPRDRTPTPEAKDKTAAPTVKDKTLEPGVRYKIASRLWNGVTRGQPTTSKKANKSKNTPQAMATAEQPIAQDYVHKPDYIPSRTFALALFDHVANFWLPADQQGGITLERVREGAKRLAREEGTKKQELGKALLSLIDAGTSPQSVLLRFDELQRMLTQLIDDPHVQKEISTAGGFDKIREIVTNDLPQGSDLQKKALALVNQTQVSVDAALKSVETWFNSAMDSIGGIYKRDVQAFVLFTGLVVSFLLGADTFRIYDALSTNPALRAAVAGQATRTVNANGQLATTPAQGATLPLTASNTVTTSTTITVTNNTTTTTTTVSTPGLREALQELNSLNLPLGYGDYPTFDPAKPPDTPTMVWTLLLWLLRKIIGVGMTGVAASLGAPFWFDLLKNLVNVRAAVRPDEDSKASKDGAKAT